MAAPDEPVREMSGSGLDAAKMDADLYFSLHVKQLFRELRVGFRTTIGDRGANVLMGVNEGKPPVPRILFPAANAVGVLSP
jgi:hypothetical protein